MRVLIAPDKFKGSLRATEAAAAIAEGWLAAWPECEVELAPIADGGEGFAEILAQALGATWVEVPVQDPLGRPVVGRYAWAANQSTAILEMSEASGLWRLKAEERAPLSAHTFGTGELVRHALAQGAERLLIGLGGSATTDGGVGLAQALGFVFRDAQGEPLGPEPEALARLAAIEPPEGLALPEVLGACDVTNPLLGARGTASVFAPQKGADPAAVATLEAGLERLAEVCQRSLGVDFRAAEGSGAAGGFGFGLLTFCSAQLRSGFELISEVLDLPARVAAADLVITGEGALDGQTLEGKGPGGVALLARQAGKPVLGLAGKVEALPALAELFTARAAITPSGMPLAEALPLAATLLRSTAERLAQQWRQH